MRPHARPEVHTEVWGSKGFTDKNNWLLRCRPSSKRCRTPSCADLPLNLRSRLCLHLTERQTRRRQEWAQQQDNTPSQPECVTTEVHLERLLSSSVFMWRKPNFKRSPKLLKQSARRSYWRPCLQNTSRIKRKSFVLFWQFIHRLLAFQVKMASRVKTFANIVTSWKPAASILHPIVARGFYYFSLIPTCGKKKTLNNKS